MFDRASLSSLLLAGLLIAGTGLSAASAQTATFGWSKGPDTPQISVALDKGLWKSEGLDMKTVTFGSGREAFEALLGGQVDFIVVADLPVVTGAMKKQPFVVVADLSRFRGSRIISTRKLTSVADLAGRKVGTIVGTSMQFILDGALQKAGVKAEIVNAAPSDLVPALSRGDVDAVLTFAGFVPQAKRILGEKYEALILPNETHLLLAASRSIVEKSPETVRKVLAGVLAADKIVQSDPNAAQEAISRLSSGAVKVESLKADWAEYDFKTELGTSLIPLLVKQGQWVSERGMIKDVAVTPELFAPYIDGRILKELDPSRVTIR